MFNENVLRFFERSRRAWSNGELSRLNYKFKELADRDIKNNIPIEKFCDDLPDLVKGLNHLNPNEGEILYALDQSCNIVLTNKRIMIRKRSLIEHKIETSFTIRNLSDISTIIQSGILFYTLRIIFHNGKSEVYKWLSYSVNPEYFMYAISRANQKSEKTEKQLKKEQRVPKSYSGEDDFIFISYKRDEFQRVSTYLNILDKKGYKIWYDKAIPGGAEWHDLIEKKVRKCKMVIVFLSQSAIESKWVRREIKYADSQDKPILTVALDKIILDHGLDLLLMNYQIISESNFDFEEELTKAIEFINIRKDIV